MDLNHLSDHRPILLKLSNLDSISTHSLGNQTEPMNVTVEDKQPQYKLKEILEKDYAEKFAKKQRR